MTTLSKFRVYTNYGNYEVEAPNPRQAEVQVRAIVRQERNAIPIIKKVRCISSASTG